MLSVWTRLFFHLVKGLVDHIYIFIALPWRLGKIVNKDKITYEAIPKYMTRKEKSKQTSEDNISDMEAEVIPSVGQEKKVKFLLIRISFQCSHNSFFFLCIFFIICALTLYHKSKI